MPLASVVFAEARMLLNDVAAKLYTDTILLPPIKKAYRELQQNLVDNGVSVARDQSTALTVGSTVEVLNFASTPALPSNLLYPIHLDEKLVGQADTDYVPMTERAWPPDLTPSDLRQYWSWLEDEIKIPQATGSTVIRVRYWGGLAAITGASTDIPILDSETFLASRTAAIAAFSLGKQPTLAAILNEDAEKALAILLSTSVKNRQALPTRRRPFRSFRFGSRFFFGGR